jgi:hypothetical protein
MAIHKLPQLHHMLDDAEHGFDRLLAQPGLGPSPFRLESVRHCVDRIGIGCQRRRLGKALQYR